MSQRKLPGTNQPILIPCYFSTSSSILLQLILRQRTFIHCGLTSTFDTDTRKYFFALAAVKAREINLQFQSKNPPLLLVCPKRLPFLPCLVVNEIYFDKLQNQYDSFVASFVQRQTLRKLPLPAVTYLTSIPISFPLIGLNQLVQYWSFVTSLT
jgi:hypothetical protein